MAPQTFGAILLVDDEPSVVRGLARLLRADGYQAETARNGREALAQLQGWHYEAIVSDLRMPELDGRAFFARLRHEYAPLHQRVIFLAGAWSEPDTQAFLEQSGQPWLRKPCTIAAIRDAIPQVHCRARAGERPS
jgi:CheY-like chemotaxis protein